MCCTVLGEFVSFSSLNQNTKFFKVTNLFVLVAVMIFAFVLWQCYSSLPICSQKGIGSLNCSFAMFGQGEGFFLNLLQENKTSFVLDNGR